ncbi:3-phosphoserine/phosphohydroxythreonine transaminase [Dechloromonas sp. XY25]|uniref:Phosphoserine aminotransferase n=1 Tax=Dechloromonas hankyongensis TaxID=2908002 RepID=A0ABS9JZQ1_9RHOO|nr:3-phosphoserine/phosphohydroxythreonine transaminase [Dechloromonas hankyongensis]MCG2576395.1 3-phosphoserine/phosphohydroxythreonine transaminase [Dechloromonas hankyongensis]
MSAWNFAAGPARLPDAVLALAERSLFARDASGACVSEQPFSGAACRALRAHASRQLAALIDLPADYRILFLAGGAMQQFSLLPLNLAAPGQRVGYVDTGYWAARAALEATLHRPVHTLPPPGDAPLAVPDDLAYCHLTTNETADGLAWPELPAPPPGVPLVADATADFLCRPLDISRFGLLYASAQKNIGVAGLTVVIVRQDLLARSPASLPALWSYARQAEADSCVNTPPVLALQLAALVFDWVAEQGGLPAMAAANRRKAALLYAAIERSHGFYRCPASPPWRSPVTVCWHLPEAGLEERFVAEAVAAGLHHLAGHPRRGGIRACLYNAMPEAGVAALAEFMADFQRRFG